ncbi:MAG: hypothetical protein V2J24_21625 [Pseudomonadales bacterium]|jgi:hypothetical protein|nr:hypothetical protein [Pseudomonadales bacterium]
MDVQSAHRWVAAEEVPGPFRRLRGVRLEEDIEDGAATFMLLEGRGRGAAPKAAVRVSGWARGLEVSTAVRGAWQPTERCPDLPLLNEAGRPASIRASLVVLSVPAPLRALAGPVSGAQIHVLRMLRKSPVACDAARANPLLTILAALRTRLSGLPLSAGLEQLAKPHDELLAWALGVRSRVAPRWLRQIAPPYDVEPGDLELLARLLTSDASGRRLRHWPSVSMSVLRRLGRRPELLAWQSVHALGSQGRMEELERLLSGVLHTENAAFFQSFDRRFRRSGHERILRELAWLAELDAPTRKLVVHTAEVPFVPPVAPGDRVRALVTAADVLEEGRRMSHCIRSYLPRIAAGRGFAYHVDTTSPATLYFRIERRRIVGVEMKGRANACASRESRDVVRGWLESGLPARNAAAALALVQQARPEQ